ncbi:MAG: sugar ABC transporter permease [Firmicutes bacterium HGW-Firmicutes-3]|jgi:simple sugar transport system permease protein|nr:MAG: sugar ABC transporter permease [Firmicutes bacterium HGW-Firmicutes-3]
MNFSALKIFKKNENILTIIIILMILVMSLISPSFFSLENTFDILRGATFIGICSIGFLFVLITNGIDISFTATATVVQFLMASLLLSDKNIPIAVILLGPIVVGGLLGALNGVLINWLKVPAIIITIATLNAYYGGIQFISGGNQLYGFPKWFTSFPRKLVLKVLNDDGVTIGLSSVTVIWILVCIIGFVILRYTMLGRKIYAVGGNTIAADRQGINVNRTRIFVHAFLGLVAGVAAIIHAMLTQTAAPNALIGKEFDVLTAVVLGGASISGGAGSIRGTVLGVLFVAILKNGLTVMAVPTFWHQIFIGLIMVASVATTATRTRLDKKKAGGVDFEEA